MPGRKRAPLQLSVRSKPPKRLKRNGPLPFTISSYAAPVPPPPSVDTLSLPNREVPTFDDCATFANLDCLPMPGGVDGEWDDTAALQAYIAPVSTAKVTLNTPLALIAKPLTNAGMRSACLAVIRIYWRGDVEDRLEKVIQPSGPAKQWPQKLLTALARLSAYGDADEIDGLLWSKVCDRTVTGDSVIRLKQVYAVLEDMERNGRVLMNVEDWL